MKLLQQRAHDSPSHHKGVMLLRQNGWKWFGPTIDGSTTSTNHYQQKYNHEVVIKANSSKDFRDEDDRQWEQFLTLTPSLSSRRHIERKEQSLLCCSRDRLNSYSSCDPIDILALSSPTFVDCSSDSSDSDHSCLSQDSDSIDFADEVDLYSTGISRGRDSLIIEEKSRRECLDNEIHNKCNADVIIAELLINELLFVLGCNDNETIVENEPKAKMISENWNTMFCSVDAPTPVLANCKSAPSLRSATLMNPKSAMKRNSSISISSCCSDDSSDNDSQDIKRSVSFSKLQIREFLSVELSDNPSCSTGPPIQLGWEYEDRIDMDVDQYEMFRLPHRKRSVQEMILPNHIRSYVLLNESGYTKAEVSDAIRQVERLKRERIDGNSEVKSDFKLQDIFHEIGQVINDMFSFGF